MYNRLKRIYAQNKNIMEESASRLSNMIYHRSLGEFVRNDNRWS